ncbi:hypothetical protein JCM10908_006729 [Rhodotorula pacifica]|uniref:glycoside hydrolase family protein n=1 Tax=Rhodotorula pacifica TaxID=1495444 RepID=UPI00316E6A5A
MHYGKAILLSLAAVASVLAAPAAEVDHLARRATTTAKTTTTRTTPTAKSAATTSRTTTSASRSTTSAKPAATAAAATLATRISAKKGVGYNDPNLTKNLAISWAYNWGQTPSGTLKSGVEYVPMLWSANAGSTWSANAQAALSSGSSHLLAFNEPDLSSQSNMTVAQSVAAWKQYMSPFVGKAKLGSMAVTNGGAPMGVAYLQSFFAACPQCAQECDFIALHWYDASWNTGFESLSLCLGSKTSFDLILTYAACPQTLPDAYNTFKKPIWLTEFAGSGTVAEQQTFFKYVIPWMENQTFIERYAGFGDFVGTYVYANASLTPLGQTYSQT